MSLELLGKSKDKLPDVHVPDVEIRGTTFLWAVFVIMLASGILVLAWSFALPVTRRVYHYIGVAILFTAATAYYTMASGIGVYHVPGEVTHTALEILKHHARPNYYARYIDWIITTPLLLLELLLPSGLEMSYILLTVFFDLLMIITGLIGAFEPSSHRWGYFIGGCIAQAFVTYVLLFPAKTSAKEIGDRVHSTYFTSTIILAILWVFYPIAWGLADGANKITPHTELIFYGVLDVLAKPVFIIYHLIVLNGVPDEETLLQGGRGGNYGTIDNAARTSA